MTAIVAIFTITVFLLVLGVIIYLRYRRLLREAKNYERGLKMVPMLIHLPPQSDDTDVGSRDTREVSEEVISKAQTLYDIISSTANKGFKSNFYGQRHISFEIVAVKGSIHYYAAVPVALVSVVEQAVVSAYPTARLEEVEEHNMFSPVGKISGTIGGELSLKEDSFKPISTFKENKRDAMLSILNSLSSLKEGDGAAIQILLRPAKSGWEKKGISYAAKARKGKDNKSKSGAFLKDLAQAPFKAPEPKEDKPSGGNDLSSLEQANLDAIEEKTRHSAYEVLVRVVASSNTSGRSQGILNNIVAAFSLFDAPGKNGFKFTPAKDIESFVTSFILRFFPQEASSTILNSVELATIFHLPDERITPTAQLERQASKQVDGPNNIPQDGLLLGYNVFRGVKKEIRLSDNDRRRHMYIVGQTGTGKSVLLENLALQDMLDGKGFAFIDPHGDTVDKLISMVPKERTEDVIYFSPADMDYPLGLNLFEFSTPDQKDFLIQEAINMLYKLYDPGHTGIIGPRYEHMFRNAALALMADPEGSTFVDIPKLFRDQQYVQQKLKHVTDQTVIEFWTKEIPASQRSNDFGEVKSWFVSKFGAFLSNEMMRNIIGQTKSSFDLRDVMDNKKILLVNLSKGRTGELNSKLLGMIFVMKFQAAAMSRANIPEDEREDFSLYVDEFQNFSTDSFATILSEARKYRLNLIVANQFIGQLTEEIRDAVFGNVGSVVSLRAGATDADFLVKQFSPTFDAEDLVKIPNYNAVVKLMIEGVPAQPFSMATIPPLGSPNMQLGSALKRLSAAKYGKPRAVVEKDIFGRLETKAPAPRPGLPGAPGALPPGQPGSGVPRSPGNGKSFLDDWLAKRKTMQQSGVKPGPFTPSQAPQTPPQQPMTPTQPQPQSAPVPAPQQPQTPPQTQPIQQPKPIVQPPAKPAGPSPAAVEDQLKKLQNAPEAAPVKPQVNPDEIYIDKDNVVHYSDEAKKAQEEKKKQAS